MALFFRRPCSYKDTMKVSYGRGVATHTMLNEGGGGPWGGRGGGSGGGSGGSGGDGGGLGPRNPWSQPPRKRPGGGNPTALDELLRRGRERFGGGLPGPQTQFLWKWAILGFVALWIIWTSVHTIGPQERGVITRLGSYAGTLTPGLRFSLPAPIDHVRVIDVDDIRNIDIGSAAEDAQNLVLTGDQNIVDLAYSVRWNVRDPDLYLFELADPDDTIREVAESAMRAEIARVTSRTMRSGPQRSQIEGPGGGSGCRRSSTATAPASLVQGVAIKQADPPAAVNDAFKAVSAAQQDAQSFLNRGPLLFAQQLNQRSRRAMRRRSTASTHNTGWRRRSRASACITRRWRRCWPRPTRPIDRGAGREPLTCRCPQIQPTPEHPRK